MCIRDRADIVRQKAETGDAVAEQHGAEWGRDEWQHPDEACLLYTSDAADERSSVDLGGRRIIKKKKRAEQRGGITRPR